VRRVTLDANVLAPGFTSRGSASSRLIDLWRTGAFELILSEHVLKELARTLTDPYFATRLPHSPGRCRCGDRYAVGVAPAAAAMAKVTATWA
jgi:predicted nucleic acid-binding protein